MSLRLVSAAICPFVQRAVIVLREKGAEYSVDYIDLANKPDWLLEISPRGKVPLLDVGTAVLFESQAICEYLDETGAGRRLAPEDPVLRARDRAWFPFSGEDLFIPIYRMLSTDDEAVFGENRDAVITCLRRLESDLSPAGEGTRDWLSGDGTQFGLADAAVAPAFTRLAILERLGKWQLPGDLAAVKAWSERLLARDSVVGSVPAQFEPESFERMKKANAWVLR